MKRFHKLVILMLVIAIACSGCKKEEKKTNTASTKNSGVDNSLNDIKDKKKLILGLDASFPPMGFKDEDDTIIGYDIDLAKEVCKRMGVELKLQSINWDNKEMELNDAKSIDCIWNGLSYSEERAKTMTLSNSYMTNKQVVIVPADSKVNTLADLKGKIVAIQNGSTAEEAVNGNEDFKKSLKELVKIDDNVKAMMDLEIGGSDAVVMDEVVAYYYMDKNAGKFKVLDQSLSDEQYVIGFRKGDQALCDEVMKYLHEMKDDGTLASITKTWFGSDISDLK